MKKILLSVLCLFSIIAVHADEVTFDFTNPTGLTPSISDALFEDAGNGALAFATSETTFTQSGITLNTTNGSTVSRIWKSAKGVYDLRVYKTATMTIAAPAGSSISSIVFAGSSVSDFSANVGTIDGKTWTGNAQEVTFTWASGTSTQKINTITVTYTAAVSGATLETPTASVEPGVFYNPTSVELSASDGEIHYTIDGTEPTAESPVYSEAIAIDNFGTTTVVKAIAIDGEEFSEIATFSYSLQIGAPEFNFDGGVYTGFGWGTDNGYLKATSTITTGAKVYYTYTIGEETTERFHYSTSANISLTETTSVTAKAYIIRTIGETKDTVFSAGVTKDYIISPIAPYKAATTITSGKKYAICANDTVIADYIFKSKTYSYLYTKNVDVKTLTRKDGSESSKFIETNDFYGYTITETANAGEYTIQDPFGRYLYISGTYTSFNLTNDATSKGDAAVWTITFDANGLATITNKEKGNIVHYSTQYSSFGAYTTTSEDYSLPTLYELGSYPKLTFSPENDSIVSKFSTFTVTCENGISSNESDELYPTYIWYTDYEYNYDENMFEYGVQTDNNTYSFTPMEEPNGNKSYSITLPEGLFTLDPGGYFETTSEEISVNFKVEDLSILEVVYANPNGEEALTSIQYLYFEFNQDIFDNVKGAAITDAEGNSYPLTVTYTDEWGTETPYNSLCLKTAEPITAPGEYTFVLSKDYIYAGTDIRMAEDATYYFTIKEPLKIVSTTPANNATVESLSDITLTFNQTMVYPNGDFCTVWGPNGEEYLFSLVGEDAEGNELPMGTWRLVAETPLTAAGEYILYLEDSFFMSYSTSGTEYSAMQQFTFYVESSAITGDLNSDNSVDVADLTMLVSMILDSSKIADAADLNGDGSVDVADLTSLVSIILGTDTATEAPAKAAATRADSLPVISAEGDGSDLLINVSNPDFPFTAIQFDIYLPEELEVSGVEEDGVYYYDVFVGSRNPSTRSPHTAEAALQPDGSMRVMVYSSKNLNFTG
ncbi:MAG: chitobiase/beta-hexosaminidase C-terminal domain-containing protein, partial [Bacteroidaceae bacterium]|nr:chitobiase/beta-hexosaminidase C-terminal domain-containing protein [Bacteroidaceae bacterium]